MTGPTTDPAAPAEVPAVSAIIACRNARSTIGDCLASLQAQAGAPPFEVIVVDSSDDGTATLIRESFPFARLVTVGHRLYPGNARNLGASVARGSILAFTDADCTVDRHWIAAIARAHRRSVPLIGGVLDNGTKDSLRAWAGYFCQLAEWMPGQPACEIPDVPAGCMTIKRSAFDVYGPFRENVYGSDTALCWNLRRHGLSPFFDPSIRVEHHCTLGYRGLLRRQFERGRTFGAMRGREQALSRPARWLHAAAAPAATLRMLLRKLALVRGAGTYRLPFVLCTPLLTAGIAAWYLGQSAGFIAGAAAVRNAVTDGVSE